MVFVYDFTFFIITFIVIADVFLLVVARINILKIVYHSPRTKGVLIGLLLAMLYLFIIPDPNHPITDMPWPHKWVHVYCNHALVWIHLDDAEAGCHSGPESRAFMSDLQNLARHPLYWWTLTIAPYSYPVISAFLIVYLLAARDRFSTRGRTRTICYRCPRCGWESIISPDN